jgi:hypothetical protein
MEFLLSKAMLTHYLHKNLSDIHLQSQLRVFTDVFSPISQHVSAPPGHPQVNTIYSYTILRKPSLFQRIRCS